MVSLGMRQALTPTTRLLGEAQWVKWSQLNVIPVVLQGQIYSLPDALTQPTSKTAVPSSLAISPCPTAAGSISWRTSRKNALLKTRFPGLARHGTLTELANRFHFREQLQQTIEALRPEEQFAPSTGPCLPQKSPQTTRTRVPSSSMTSGISPASTSW